MLAPNVRCRFGAAVTGRQRCVQWDPPKTRHRRRCKQDWFACARDARASKRAAAALPCLLLITGSTANALGIDRQLRRSAGARSRLFVFLCLHNDLAQDQAQVPLFWPGRLLKPICERKHCVILDSLAEGERASSPREPISRCCSCVPVCYCGERVP